MFVKGPQGYRILMSVVHCLYIISYQTIYMLYVRIIQGWFTDIPATVWFLQCQVSNHDVINFFPITGPLWGEPQVTGEFPSQKPVTRNFDVCFDLHLNTRVSKQSRNWWFETPSHSFWRHCIRVWVNWSVSCHNKVPQGVIFVCNV